MRFTPLIPLLLIPGLALAYNYEPSALPYNDAPSDLPSAIAIGVLTDEGIVEGYADNTFRPDTAINRAEFTKIAMGIRLRNQQLMVDTTVAFWMYISLRGMPSMYVQLKRWESSKEIDERVTRRSRGCLNLRVL